MHSSMEVREDRPGLRNESPKHGWGADLPGEDPCAVPSHFLVKHRVLCQGSHLVHQPDAPRRKVCGCQGLPSLTEVIHAHLGQNVLPLVLNVLQACCDLLADRLCHLLGLRVKLQATLHPFHMCALFETSHCYILLSFSRIAKSGHAPELVTQTLLAAHH